MSFLPAPQLRELLTFAYIADREARSDLSRGFIRDENDYTSNFTGALRRIINSNSETGLTATSFVLEHPVERQIGGDATIILSRGAESKVAVFEAKFPRFSTPGYRWDYEQTASGLSHFSDQLERQKQWSEQVAIFEMFYCDDPLETPSEYLISGGSSCVWQADAETFRSNRPDPDEVWTQQELQRLLQSSRKGISEVLNEFGLCQKGSPIRSTNVLDIGKEYGLPQQLLAITALMRGSRKRE